MKRKIMALLLTLAMVVAYMPAMAVTAFAETPKLVAPTEKTLEYTGYEQELVYPGTPAEGHYLLYSLNANGPWNLAIPKAKNADTYTVYYKSFEDPEGEKPSTEEYTFEGSLPVTISKAKPVNIAPQVIPAQQYTGSALNLIKSGTGTVNAGTILYAFSDTATALSWSTTATQIATGSYSVYYKVELSETEKLNYEEVSATLIGTAKIVGPAKVTLRYTSYAYNGLTKAPEIVRVVGYDGLEIPSSAYQVTGETSATTPGTYTFTVTGNTADYKWSVDRTWKITVKKTSIKSLKKGSKSFTIKVKELDEDQVDGYQVRYSTKKSMSGAKIKKIGSDSETVQKTIKSLKKGKKYYVQARSYVTVNGVKYYSDWSAKKTVKTK